MATFSLYFLADSQKKQHNYEKNLIYQKNK